MGNQNGASQSRSTLRIVVELCTPVRTFSTWEITPFTQRSRHNRVKYNAWRPYVYNAVQVCEVYVRLSPHTSTFKASIDSTRSNSSGMHRVLSYSQASHNAVFIGPKQRNADATKKFRWNLPPPPSSPVTHCQIYERAARPGVDFYSSVCVSPPVQEFSKN